MNNSWSSRQRISHEDQISLAKDLLALSMKLQKPGLSIMGTMMITKDMILDTTQTNFNRELNGLDKVISTNGLRSKD